MFGPLKCKTLRLAKVWKPEGFTYGCGVLWVKPGSDGTQEIETIANAGRSLGAGVTGARVWQLGCFKS